MIRLSAQAPAMQMGPIVSHKSCPAGPSPLGEPATMDKLRSARLSENWTSTIAPVGLLVGMDQPGDPVGPVLDSYQASRGLDTMSAISSETQTDVCSAKDDNTNELTQIGTDSVTRDRDTPPVKAAGALTSAGMAGSCQAAGTNESRSTSIQPGGLKVLTAVQQTPKVSAVPDHNDLAHTQNIRTGDVSIAANVVYNDGLRMYRSRSRLAWWRPLLPMVCNGETTQSVENPANPQQIAGDDFTQQ